MGIEWEEVAIHRKTHSHVDITILRSTSRTAINHTDTDTHDIWKIKWKSRYHIEHTLQSVSYLKRGSKQPQNDNSYREKFLSRSTNIRIHTTQVNVHARKQIVYRHAIEWMDTLTLTRSKVCAARRCQNVIDRIDVVYSYKNFSIRMCMCADVLYIMFTFCVK